MSDTLVKSFKPVCLSNPDLCFKTILKNVDFVFEWRIEDLHCILDRNYEIPSPSFTVCKKSNEKWKLVLFPKHTYPAGANLSVSLIKLSSSEKPCCLKYSYSCVDKEGNIHQTNLREKKFSKIYDFDECILLNHALLTESKFLPNNCLTIRCEVNFIRIDSIDDEKIVFPVEVIQKEKLNNIESSIEVVPNEKLNIRNDSLYSSSSQQGDSLKNLQSFYKSTEKKNNFSYNKYNIANDETEENILPVTSNNARESSLSDLSSNLKALYITKDFSDVVICTDDAEIRAHKAILSTRSDYFKNIFSSKSGNKLILDIQATALESFLLYLYSGMEQMSVKMSLYLLSAAIKFNDLQCQELVTNVLKSSITVDNVTDILQHSEDLKSSELKYECLKFVNSNYSEVMQTEKWEKMIKNNPHIAGEALITIASYQKKNVL